MKGRNRFAVPIASILMAIIMVFTSPAMAAASSAIVETHTDETSVNIYLLGQTSGQTAKAQLGTEEIGEVSLQSLEEAAIPIVTWILLDNSVSIKTTDRTKITDFITELIAGRQVNEKITLCTIDDHLNVLLRESKNYAELKRTLGEITYANQNTYLTDAIYEMLDDEKDRSEEAFVRCIIIGDGEDGGKITKDELYRRLLSQPIPIYTLGCSGKENELKDMYAISRESGAQSWALSEVSDPLTVVSSLSEQELPVYARIEIPSTQMDGSKKAVLLTFQDSSTVRTEVEMPFVQPEVQSSPVPTTTVSPPPSPTMTSDPNTAEPPIADTTRSDIWKNIVIVAAGILTVVAAVIIILLVKKRSKKRSAFEHVNGSASDSGYASMSADPTKPAKRRDGAASILGEAGGFSVELQDIEHSDKFFNIPLYQNRIVKVGRDNDNDIKIQYDTSVPRKSFEMELSGSQVFIRDVAGVKGSNPVIIDGYPIGKERTELWDNCTLVIGDLTFHVSVKSQQTWGTS